MKLEKNVVKNKLIVYGSLVLILFVTLILGVYYVKQKHKIKFFDHANSLNVSDKETYNLQKGDVYEQRIISRYANFNKIKFTILSSDRTGNIPYYDAYITVGLKDLNGNVIDEYQFNRIFFEDDYSVNFEFPMQKDSKNKEYILYIKAIKSNNFPVLVASNSQDGQVLTINDVKTDQSLLFRSYYYNGENELGYILLGGITLITVILVLSALHFKLSITNKYLLFSIILFLLNTFMVPLYQGQDELAHIQRVYEITDGKFVSEKIDDWLGYNVPIGLNYVEFSSYNNISSRMEVVDPNKTMVANMEYMAVYSPINYLPQSIGLKLARLFSDYPLVWAYTTRIFQAIFCIICVYFAIKIIPFGKNIIFLVGLLPSFLDASTLVSLDGVLSAISILFIAKILQVIYDKKTINKKDWILLLLLAIGLALCKLVFFPLIFLILLIPMHFKEVKKFHVISVILVSIILMFVWNSIAMHNLVNGQGLNTMYIIKRYLMNPLDFIRIFFNTFVTEIGSYISDLAGGRNRWNDAVIYDPSLVSQLFILFFMINIFKGDNKLEKKDKYLIGFLTFVTYALINVSLLISVTPVHYDTIFVIQGRYLIPLLLPLYFVCANNKGSGKEYQFNSYIPLLYLLYYVTYFTKFI